MIDEEEKRRKNRFAPTANQRDSSGVTKRSSRDVPIVCCQLAACSRLFLEIGRFREPVTKNRESTYTFKSDPSS